ncbi:hypothetical protein N665_3303s0001 [Sinapis alba]|nr:hypothetical protein N665_3303s0001 [Sinapis alba]
MLNKLFHFIINRTPTKVLHDLSPFEVLNKTKPPLDHLRVFGCLCFVLIGEQRNKLDAKSSKAMFIGYSPTQKGYKCYDPMSRRVLISRDVKFMETKGYYEEKSWDDLKDLSQASEKATNLRIILESLGIGMPQENQETRKNSPEAAPGPEALVNEDRVDEVIEMEAMMSQIMKRMKKTDLLQEKHADDFFGNDSQVQKDAKIKRRRSIPSFCGRNDHNGYLEWEQKMELVFDGQNYSESKKVRLATSEFCGDAIQWWNQLVTKRKRTGEAQVASWFELKHFMKKHFVSSNYNRKQPRQAKEDTRPYHDFDQPRKSQSHKQRRPDPRPLSRVNEPLCSKKKSAIQEHIKESIFLSQETLKIENVTSDCANDSYSCHDREHMGVEEPKKLQEERGNHTEEEKEVSDCLPWLKDKGETKLLEKYESSFLCFEFLPEVTPDCDELTCFEPVQPSSIDSVSQVLEENPAEEAQKRYPSFPVLTYGKFLKLLDATPTEPVADSDLGELDELNQLSDNEEEQDEMNQLR